MTIVSIRKAFLLEIKLPIIEISLIVFRPIM